MARFFTSIFGVIGAILAFFIWKSVLEPRPAAARAEARPKSGNPSPPGNPVSRVTQENPTPKTQQSVMGSNTQQRSPRFIPPIPGESGRKVAAMTDAEELELLQIEMAYDRSSDRRDPKITERWFELRKQSRLLRTGMARQEAIQLLGTPTREGVNTKGFFLDYTPKPYPKRMYHNYENLVLNFNPNGQLRTWDWYTPYED